jgi:hypothetical protein
MYSKDLNIFLYPSSENELMAACLGPRASSLRASRQTCISSFESMDLKKKQGGGVMELRKDLELPSDHLR